MTVAYIPDEEVERLNALRKVRDMPALRSRVLALRLSGWTLAGIGKPLARKPQNKVPRDEQTGEPVIVSSKEHVPFSTVRAWEQAASPLTDPIPTDVPTPPRPSRKRGHVIRIKKMRVDVPSTERPILLKLTQEASIIRRTIPQNHPARTAQRQLNELLAMYVERGVPIAYLARYCGVTNRAIAARLERYQQKSTAIDPVPSEITVPAQPEVLSPSPLFLPPSMTA